MSLFHVVFCTLLCVANKLSLFHAAHRLAIPAVVSALPIVMRSRIYASVGRPSVCLSVRPPVRPFVRLSVSSIRPPHAAVAGICCCGPGSQQISSDCCTTGGPAVSSSRAAARRAGCGQCHVVSRRRKLKTDLFNIDQGHF